VGEKNILAENKELTVYPNPASDYIVLRTNFNVLKNNTLQVFSSNGRLVDQCTQTGQNFEYNCSHLADGLYLFRMVADGQIVTKKFLVVRR